MTAANNSATARFSGKIASWRPAAAVACRQIGRAALLLLALALPFEMVNPWLRLGAVRLTNLEIVLLLVLTLALLAWRLEPAVTRPWPRFWLGLGLVYLTAVILTAILAPEFRLNALKAGLRVLGGLGLLLAVRQLIRRQDQVIMIMAALLTGGLISLSAGIVEMNRGVLLPWLALFRPEPTLAGPFLRLSGSFNHANQAAMFIEAGLPLLLALTWLAWQAQRNLLAGGLGLVGLLYLEAALLTYSRASVIVLLFSNLLIILLYFRWPVAQRRLVWLSLALTGFLALLLIGHIWYDPVFQLRWQSEDDSQWYQVRIEAPPRLIMRAGQVTGVTLLIANDGPFTWPHAGPQPVQLGAQWLEDGDPDQLAMSQRWPLPRPLPPGDFINLTIDLEAPLFPALYQLEWDLVQENVTWFSRKSGIINSSQVEVVAATQASTAIAATRLRPPVQPLIPDRRTLWTVAWAQWRQRPWLGIGLDNFRLTYGRWLNAEQWDNRIHSNNWYLELLVSLGVIGTLPFFAWLISLSDHIRRAISRPTATPVQVALAIALFAYLLHGCIDYFLMYHATALLFWLLVGLWLTIGPEKEAAT
jgi:hypothetical protein